MTARITQPTRKPIAAPRAWRFIIIDLLRARLLASYRERIGELDVCPSLSRQVDDFSGLNLPKSAGFLISLLDGNTSVTDLVSLSGMDAFEALSTLAGLLDAGVVELPA